MRIGPWHLAFAAGGFLVGLALGGLGPRSALREARAEARAASRSPRGAGTELARIFQGRPLPDRAETPSPTPDGAADQPPSEGPESAAEAETPSGGAAPDERAAIREALALRQTQARAALLEDAEPTEVQVEQIDAAVADMNTDLKVLATEFVARFDASEPSRRNMMVFAADTLDVLIDTEDRLAETLTDEQMDAVREESLDPLSYVDPSLLDVLAELDR